jgi:uncharacterized membrane protein
VSGLGFFRDMKEDESSALWQALIYVGLMVLVVFGTIALWSHVNVLLLLGLPVLFYMAQGEWEAYKRFKMSRKTGERNKNEQFHE